MTGHLIAVVGPSGVGKDSVMAGIAAARPDIAPIRRTITRPEGAGGEDCETVTAEDFAALRDAGAFALDWGAHGLAYGIRTEALAPLGAGATLMVNLSRSVLDRAATLAPAFTILSLSAAPAVLAARLAGRGRESADQIAARLARDPGPGDWPGRVVQVSNDGPLDATVAAALAALSPARV